MWYTSKDNLGEILLNFNVEKVAKEKIGMGILIKPNRKIFKETFFQIKRIKLLLFFINNNNNNEIFDL